MENEQQQQQQQQLLPLGFRFYPTEEELITYYLHQKLHALPPDLDRVIPSIDIYKFEPCRLPGLAGEVCNGETEQWFFFSPRQEREARGGRPNRTTGSGYWKATGSPTYVYSSENNKVIGMKKTMVFYKGKAPTGRKTKWKMNEYKAIKFLHQYFLNQPNTSSLSTIPEMRHELSLCRVYITSGCARAFDRRPSGRLQMPNINTNATPKDDQVQANGSDGCCLQNNGKNKEKILMEKSFSASTDDSSNSGGNYNETQGDVHAHAHAHAAGEGSNCSETQIADEMDTLWDLEHLSWL